MYSTCQLRKFLDEHLNILTPSLWIEVFENYKIDLDIIREYKDFVQWQVLWEYDVMNSQIPDEDFLNAMREFKQELHWIEGNFRKWYEELRFKYK